MTTSTTTKTTGKGKAAPVARLPRDQREKKVKVWLDQTSQTDLKAAQEIYAAILGRPATATLCIRRGLTLLAEHLAEMEPSQIDSEKSRLFDLR